MKSKSYNLMYIKNHLMSMYSKEMDVLKKENLSHIYYLIDELILNKDRVSQDEILREVEIYSEYMLELKMVYYVLKGILKERVDLE